MLSWVLFYKMDNFVVTSLAPLLWGWGQQLYRQGIDLQGEFANPDKLQPSMRCIPLSNTIYPKLLEADWVAPNATVIGDVELKEGASLWFGTIVRGDTAQVWIGKNTLVLDRVQIESTAKDLSKRIDIGDNVFIGPNTKIYDAKIESFAFIGPGSIVHSGAVIEGYGMVAAGSEVAAGTVVQTG